MSTVVSLTKGVLPMGKGLIQPWHILILVVVIVIVFGWKRLPDAARSLGRSMRIFKSEVDEMKHDGKTPPSAASSDTVKGETVRENTASTASTASTAKDRFDPTADAADSRPADSTAREPQKQPPA